MTWKSYALVSGAGVLGTYLLSTPAPATNVTAPSRRAAARVELVSDIEEQAERLHARLRTPAAYNEPARNPFRFSQRSGAPAAAETERASVTGPVGALPVLPVVPPLPAISLVGIAEDEAGGSVQRTAILKTALGVVLVRKGDAVGVEYTVREVGPTGVELIGSDGAVRRIVPGP